MNTTTLKPGDKIQGKAPNARRVATVKEVKDNQIHVTFHNPRKGSQDVDGIWEGEYNIISSEQNS